MRRIEREVTELDEILSIVKACDVLRLAMIDMSGQPYLVPLNFGWEFDDQTMILYFHCAKEGRKLEILRQNPRVCFEMDTDHKLTLTENPCRSSFSYRSVIGWGVVELLEGHEAKANGLKAIMRHAGNENVTFSVENTRSVEVGSIRVEQLTAKQHV